MPAEGRAKVLIKVTLLGFAAAIAGLDQSTKALARSSLDEQGVVLIRGWLELELSKNSGGAFGMLPGGRAVFLGAVSILLIGVVIGIGRIEKRSTAIALGVLVGGAVGNGIDRLLSPGGMVTDFIKFRWWPTFNVADIAIVIGSLLVAIIIWRRPVEPSQDADSGGTETIHDETEVSKAAP